MTPLLDNAGLTCKGPIGVNGQSNPGPSDRKPELTPSKFGTLWVPFLSIGFHSFGFHLGVGVRLSGALGGKAGNLPTMHIKRSFPGIFWQHMCSHGDWGVLCARLWERIRPIRISLVYLGKKKNCEKNRLKPKFEYLPHSSTQRFKPEVSFHSPPVKSRRWVQVDTLIAEYAIVPGKTYRANQESEWDERCKRNGGFWGLN